MDELSLPPDISVTRQGNIYVILKNGHCEIGGVVVRGNSHGNTLLEPYVNEPQDKNKTIVAQVAEQMTEALVMHEARKPEHLRNEVFPPDNVPPGTQVFENKLFPCSRCNRITARLIFAWDCASEEEMKMVGKKFELEASLVNYPVWVLGAPDGDNEDTARHLTLQIAPMKGKVYWEHPDDMNNRLIELDNKHRCK